VRHGLLVVNQLVHRVVFIAILLWNQLFVMVVGQFITVHMEIEIFTPKTASVVPPEDGRLTPETCRD
jgi:hypothetical protein